MNAPQDSFVAALAAREHAYAPYSGYRVGAAIATASGDVIAGCNVENSSFGATICAERNALIQAIARHGRTPFDHIVVVAAGDPLVVPCALCLQVMQEFCPPDFPIHLATPEGIRRTATLGELLPEPFTTIPPQA